MPHLVLADHIYGNAAVYEYVDLICISIYMCVYLHACMSICIMSVCMQVSLCMPV